MAGEWPDVRLGDVASEITVGWVGPMTDEYLDVGIPFLRSLNVAPYRIDLGDLKYISTQFHMRIGKSRLRPGDLVVVRTGRPGTAAVIPTDIDEANCSDLVIVRPSGQLDTRYAMYYLNSHMGRNSVDARLVGSVQHHFNIGDAKSLILKLPPLPEQRVIARILGALDDKIELNRRMNASLEAIARALFQSWFVDFDPVRAKAEGRHPAGMDAATAALFPDAFEESPLGMVPRGWRVGTIGEVAEVIDCLHSKKPERQPMGRPLLQLWNIRDDGLLDLSDTYWITDADYDAWTARMEAQCGDCVITNVGRVGATAQIPEGLRAALGRNMTGLRCRPTWSFPTFLIQALLSSTVAEEIKRKTDTGTILDALNVRNIPLLRLVLAPTDVLARFEMLARPFRAKMEHGLEESSTLAAIRDALLPKLLSGAVRVREAEALVEAAI